MKKIYVIFAFWLAGCTAYADLNSFDGLSARVQAYYTLEQKNEWEKAYAYRTPAFRQTIHLPYYLSQISKDSAGWKLKEFKIISAEKKNNKVYVKMEFVDEGPANFFPKEMLPSNAKLIDHNKVKLRIMDDSVWVRVDNQWYVYNAVARMHLGMNDPAEAD